MRIAVPDLCLVVLVGTSGAGKSTFASRHFLPTEVVSSDACRALVSDDPNDMGATKAAFEVVHLIASKRLEAGRLTVIDATNVQREARAPLVHLAREQYCLPVAIVLDLPERLCQDRNRGRPDRAFGPHVVRNQHQQLRRSLRGLEREGFRRVFVLRSPDQVDDVELVREPLWTDRRRDHGPFDVIGDVHGCLDELVALLGELGYRVEPGGAGAAHPDGRTAVFVGDLVDRGPDTPGVLRLVMGMVEAGAALCVPGNHESKLLRKLKGRDVQLTHGLPETLAQLEGTPEGFVERLVPFLDGLISHYVLDDGRLVVAHAGMPERMQGRAAARVRDFALYGETTGETDEFGLPVRYPWAQDYRGPATVVYGHTPVPETEWLNRTICVDTGCVFGGRLTALRWPERALVSVPAARTYYEPARPFLPLQEQPPAEPERDGDLLDIDDVLGKRQVLTGMAGPVTIREEHAAAALEVMSRFAADPRWLVYLPPTMAPPRTTSREGLLEHPAEAFADYLHDGVPVVVCEEKHMGSRAVVVVCRDGAVAERRFRVASDAGGVCVTRTGRPFFADAELEADVVGRVRAAVEAAGLWDGLGTDWLALDCELLPWSVKAEDLLKREYAAVGAASGAGLAASVAALEGAAGRGVDVAGLLAGHRDRLRSAEAFVEAYRGYCWPVASVADLRVAPFQVLAAEGEVLALRDRAWHAQTIDALCARDEGFLRPTRRLVVDLTDPDAQAAGERWWSELTASGGEGIVVKPLALTKGRRGLVQPGLKVRGPDYLRIVYGPEYAQPANLARLRARTTGHKRSLAVREFALGIEALQRFVRGEPLYRVHECVFGVLALESEPVDPAL